MRNRGVAARRKRRQRLLGDPAALIVEKAKKVRYDKRRALRKKYEAVLANPAVADAAELNRARAWQRARLIASDPVLSEKRNKAAAKNRDEHREEAVKCNVEWRRNNRELYNALKLMRKRKARARLRAKPQAPNVCAEMAMLGINFGALEEQQDGQR